MADPEILHPGDDGYDESRAMWNAMVDRRPAMIVRCRETRDVVRAVALAEQEQARAALVALEVRGRRDRAVTLSRTRPAGGQADRSRRISR